MSASITRYSLCGSEQPSSIRLRRGVNHLWGFMVSSDGDMCAIDASSCMQNTAGKEDYRREGHSRQLPRGGGGGGGVTIWGVSDFRRRRKESGVALPGKND